MIVFPSILVFLTGAGALILELVWARWLMLTIGAGTQSLAVVLAGTMLGLAVGSELGGQLANRVTRRLRLYGLIELGAAALALFSSRFLMQCSFDGFGVPAQFELPLSLFIVGVPTAVMGASFPTLMAYVGSSDEKLRSGFSRLYAVNTAGAVVGALAAGFWLISSFGLWASALTACAATALAGIAALWADLEESEATPRQPLKAPAATRSYALVAAAASGFAVMSHEVLDTRFLVQGFLSTTHAMTLILACFLAGLALGAEFCTRKLSRAKASAGDLGIALMLAGALTFALAPSLTCAAALAAWFRLAPWAARIAYEAAILSILLIPATTAMGFAFPIAASLYCASPKAGPTSGRVLLVNMLAGVAGALVAAFVLLPALGLRASVAVTVLTQAVVGAWVLSRYSKLPAWGVKTAWIACAALAVCGAAWSRPPRLGGPPGDGTLIPQQVFGREQYFRVLCYHESALATTEVLERTMNGLKDLFIDGFLTAGDAPGAGYMTLMGRLPMKLAARAKRALVICFGTGATARAVGETPQAAVDIVDINPDVFACAPSFGPDNERLLARANAVVMDGRRFLRGDGPPYDVITQEPMPPYFAGTAALYSVEYYKLARRRLAEDGVIVQWLPLHLVAPIDARQIVATAQAVFPETWVALAKDGTGLVVSSPTPLDEKRRLDAEKELGARFALDPEAARHYAAGADLVTDDRPILEYSGLDHVRARFATSVDLHAYNLSQLLAAEKKN